VSAASTAAGLSPGPARPTRCSRAFRSDPVIAERFGEARGLSDRNRRRRPGLRPGRGGMSGKTPDRALGLASLRERLPAHGGACAIRSQPGHGTTVSL
jgi:hypothetical protein